MQVLRRGMRDMDVEQGTMGHGWPFETTLGAASERGNPERSAGPYAGANGFGYFCLDKSNPPEGAEPICRSDANAAYAYSRRFKIKMHRD